SQKANADHAAANWQRRIVLWGAVGIGGLGAIGGLVWFFRQSLSTDRFGWDEIDHADGDPEEFDPADSHHEPLVSANSWTPPRASNPAVDPQGSHAEVERSPSLGPTAAIALEPPATLAPPEMAPKPKRFPWQKARSPEPAAKPASNAAPSPIASSPQSSQSSQSSQTDRHVEAEPIAPATAPAPAALPSPAALSPTRVVKPSPIERAIQNLRSESAADRRKAIWELGQRGDSRAIQPLMEVLLNGDSKQRSLAIASLSAIGSRVLEPTLEAMALALRDHNPEVRTNAIRDLTQVYEQVARLSQMMGLAARDTDQQVQQTASWALGKLEQIRSIADSTQGAGGSSLSMTSFDESALAQGLDLLESNRPAEAAPLLEKAIQQHPSDPDAHLALAQALEARGAIAQAHQEAIAARDLYVYQGRADAARAIEQTWHDRGIDPDQAAYRVAWASLLIQREEWDEAASELEQAIVHNPHDPDPYLALARLRRAQHRPTEAVTHLQQARDLYLAAGDRAAADRLQSLIQSA
ncbi:MAG TPA: tetratricopeptide repeat protein, partial [Coleofasciculaceae cyanobacterium]